MNPSTSKKLDERLSSLGPVPEPPADLLDRLVAEVPPRLTLAPEIADPPNVVRPRFGRPAQRWMAVAALLVAAVGGTFVGLGVFEERARKPATSGDFEAPRAAPAPALTDANLPTGARPAPPAAKTPPPPELDKARAQEATEEQKLGIVGAREERDGRRYEYETEAAADEGVEVGVVGGVEGGVAGGVPGGVVGGVPAPEPSVQPVEVSTAREPWSVLESAPGVQVDRVNVGGNEAGVTNPAVRDRKQLQRVLPPSTGGTAEPNDQPYGDVFFQDYGTNPFLDPAEDRLSTFALEVDTGSYAVARRFLGDGHRPPPAAIRVEEMLNAFDYRDSAPERGDFAITAEAAPTPFGQGELYRVIRFGIKAREIHLEDRRKANLTFVVDVSGSMAEENRLELVKKALGLLVDRLGEDDRVALVVYGDDARVVEPGTGDLVRLRWAIEQLSPEGATNAEAGLRVAYDLARRNFRANATNRVILCSDGVANVGATGPGSILERIGEEARKGIELTTVGFGMGNYNDVLMEQLADRGNGRYAYVDSETEARRLFVAELAGTLETVAADAKAQVEFDPRYVDRYRLVGYENRDVADARFRDDTVDAGEIGAGHRVTALYEIRLKPEVPPSATIAVLRLRWRSVAEGRVIEQEEPLRASEIVRSFETAPRGLQLAAVVAEFGEILKGTYWARGGDLDSLARRAERLAFEEFGGDVQVSELARLIERAAEVTRREGPAR